MRYNVQTSNACWDIYVFDFWSNILITLFLYRLVIFLTRNIFLENLHAYIYVLDQKINKNGLIVSSRYSLQIIIPVGKYDKRKSSPAQTIKLCLLKNGKVESFPVVQIVPLNFRNMYTCQVRALKTVILNQAPLRVQNSNCIPRNHSA